MTLPILLVDDDPDTCDTMAKLFKAYGYQADIALDGPAALQRIEHRRYGLAVVDYQMPGMNGVDLIRRIRRARPNLPAIFLTGYATIDVVYPAIESGVLRVFSKPVNFPELLAVVEEHLSATA
jgi:CheY-like chemotaxis protein